MKRKWDVQESLVTDFRMFLQTETSVTVSLQQGRNKFLCEIALWRWLEPIDNYGKECNALIMGTILVKET